MKITPDFILLPLKLGGSLKYVPLPITEKKQYTFAVKFVIKLIRDKNRIIKIKTIAETLILAISGKGQSIDKKMLDYGTAMQNRHLIRFFK